MLEIKRDLVRLLCIGLSVVFYGCAGSAPTAEFKKPIVDAHRLCPNDEATVKLLVSDGILVNDVHRQRLESQISQSIIAKKKSAQCKQADKRSFLLNAKVTRYDEGNAFARAMLAGLGQIHIDADFTLTLLPASETVAEFSVQKTFAWGGIYGASTRIEDVEPAFAVGVAEAIVAEPAAENSGADPAK